MKPRPLSLTRQDDATGNPQESLSIHRINISTHSCKKISSFFCFHSVESSFIVHRTSQEIPKWFECLWGVEQQLSKRAAEKKKKLQRRWWTHHTQNKQRPWHHRRFIDRKDSSGAARDGDWINWFITASHHNWIIIERALIGMFWFFILIREFSRRPADVMF